MQAIILAAGMGSRLKDKTANIPKALVPINGVPLIINSLNILSSYEISEVIIVIGYLKDKIKDAIGNEYRGMKIIYVENDIYNKTNNIYSLYLTKDFVNDDVLLLECDLYFPNKLIDYIINEDNDCSILVSKYNNKTMNGTVITFNNDYHVNELFVKNKQNNNFSYIDKYKTVNIYKFSRDFFLKKYIPQMEVYMNIESMNSYYELVLGALIYYNNDNIKAIVVSENLWREVDDEKDLVIAKETKWHE